MPSDSRQAISALFDGKGFTRMGLRDVPWPETLLKWSHQGYPTTKVPYMDDYSGGQAFAEFEVTDFPVDAIDYFQMDLVKCGFYWDVYPFRGRNELISSDENTFTVENGAGARFRHYKKRSVCPEHISFDMTTPEKWYEVYKPQLLPFDPLRVKTEVMKEKFDKRRAEGQFIYFSTMFVWESLRSSLGDVCLYESMLLEPEWMHDFCRTYTDFYKQYMSYVFEHVGVPDGVLLLEDLAYKNTPFCSPKTYDQIIFPYYREIVQFLKERGIYAMLHSCGCVTTLLPYVAEIGFQLLNPMEAKAGCDLESFVKQYKNQFVFMGGMNEMLLETGDLPLIRRETQKILDLMKAEGARYIFGTDHSVSSNVDLASFQTAVDVFHANKYY
jgi:hypothetical protein